VKKGSVPEPEGIWPQGKVDYGWPSGASVEKLLACTVGKVMNGTLRDLILEMCIDATEGKLLAAALT
jgi:hypothetical protein